MTHTSFFHFRFLKNLCLLSFIFFCSCSKVRVDKKANTGSEGVLTEQATNPISTAMITCNPVSLNRYYNASTTDYLYLAEATPAFSWPGWSFQQRVGSVSTCLDKTLTAFYRYYNSAIQDHLYSTIFATIPGYTYEGIACYVYPSTYTTDPAAVPLYRHFSSSQTNHFYTTIPGAIPGYTYEGIACKIAP